MRHRDDLRQLAAREKGRLASPGLTAATRRSIRRTVAFLEGEAGRVQKQADELIAASEALAADRALPESIPGIGAATASTLLGELPDLSHVASAQQAAAYAGLAPREYRSGATVRKRTRRSQAGNARLRQALYLPALTAIRFNPLLKGFFERLVAAGKPKMQAVGAGMRKLVMLCYGVLKNRAAFDPDWASKKTS
jgi:transposase